MTTQGRAVAAQGRVEAGSIFEAGRAAVQGDGTGGLERFLVVHGHDRQSLLEEIQLAARRGRERRWLRIKEVGGRAGRVDPTGACLGMILGDPRRRGSRIEATRIAAAMGAAARREGLRLDAWARREGGDPRAGTGSRGGTNPRAGAILWLRGAQLPAGLVPLVAFALGVSRKHDRRRPARSRPGDTPAHTLLLGFSALAQEVHASRDRAGILATVARDLAGLVGAGVSGAAEVDASRGVLVLRHVHHAPPPPRRAGRVARASKRKAVSSPRSGMASRVSRLPLSRDHALGWTAWNREPLRLEGLRGRRGFVRLPGRTSVRAAMLAPLIARDRVEGVLFAGTVRAEAFTQADWDLFLHSARLVSIALENVLLYQEVKRLASSDALTGVANHRVFRDVLHREMERCRRYHHPLSLLMMDLDHFKDWNDAHGHPAGDRILREVATRLTGAVRHIDLVARYGGDEFAVVLPQIGLAGLRAVAERIRQSVCLCGVAPEEGQKEVRVDLSIGGATFPEHARDPEGLLRAADRAMYRAKAGGGRRIHLAGSS